MIKVIAIRKINGKQIKSIHLTGIATAQEATNVIAQMLGQDGIIDGYWDDEEPETAPVPAVPQPRTILELIEAGLLSASASFEEMIEEAMSLAERAAERGRVEFARVSAFFDDLAKPATQPGGVLINVAEHSGGAFALSFSF